MMDKGTQHYINEERARCAALVKLLRAEPDFLVFCIETPVHPGEDLDHWRKRFEEHKPVDPFEDLM